MGHGLLRIWKYSQAFLPFLVFTVAIYILDRIVLDLMSMWNEIVEKTNAFTFKALSFDSDSDRIDRPWKKGRVSLSDNCTKNVER